VAVGSVKPAVATLDLRDFCAQSEEESKEETKEVTKQSKVCRDERVQVSNLGV
jgi:hypothetical protein